ncbi:hypothetical protein Tco_1054195 [Tanacetum coccineum]|uniref:Uncharacterized protein n=1 Tax=Tanacetum coccineum TaxID=301880 RepID=A0ABQ5GYI5_9ASTR
MNLCGYGTKSLGLGITFLSMTIFCGLDWGIRSTPMVIVGCMNASIYACSDSLLLTPLCCDDIHDVTPRVSALAGCDTLVDKKKVIITESTIRRDLQLEDANGVDCLSNAAIFKQLTLMGYEKLSQKLTFLQGILFSSMEVFNSYNFAMPKFVQIFMNKQVGDMSHHKRIYVTPSHTKNIFGNIKREGKCFSRRVTPLFQTMLVQAHEEIGKGSDLPTDPHHTPIITQPSSSQPQRKQKFKKSKKKNTEVPQPGGSTENVPDENVSTTSNDPLLSGEDRLKLTELMDLYTNLQKKVLDLEKAKTAQDSEISSLKKKVRKLERRNKSRTLGLKRLRKVGSARRVESFDEASLGVLDEQVVEVEKVVSTAEVTIESATTTTVDELTLAQILIEIKAAKPKVKGVMIQEPSKFTTTTPAASKPLQDKGKAKMIESDEPLKMKPKDQVLFDEQEAIRLQAQFDEEERIAIEKEEANAALIAQWNDIQDKVETDYELA